MRQDTLSTTEPPARRWLGHGKPWERLTRRSRRYTVGVTLSGTLYLSWTCSQRLAVHVSSPQRLRLHFILRGESRPRVVSHAFAATMGSGV
jgi:hypothetical protein